MTPNARFNLKCTLRMAHLTYECCTEKGKALMQMLKIGNFSHSVASFLSCLEICGRLLYIVCFHLYLCHTINTYHVCIVIWVGYFNLLFPLISCKNRYTYLTDLSTCKFKLQAVFLFVTDMWSFTKLMTENHFHLELYISSVPMPLLSWRLQIWYHSLWQPGWLVII